MRDAAGENTEAFELLGLEQLALEIEPGSFGLLLSGDVDDEAFEHGKTAVAGFDAATAREHPFFGAVLGADATLDLDVSPLVQRSARRRANTQEIVAVDEVAEPHRAGNKILGRITGERECTFAYVDGGELVAIVAAKSHAREGMQHAPD